MSGKHAPNRFGRYLAIHDKALADFRQKGLVESDSLVLEAFDNGYLRMSGEILCVGEVHIDVVKTLEILDGRTPAKLLAGHANESIVQNIRYSYNARLVRPGRTISIFRYDNVHERYGHHRHGFRWPSGRKDGRPIALTEESYPTLAEVIQEAAEWYWAHASELAPE